MMRRLVIAAVLLVGCGDEPGPHDQVPCEQAKWGPLTVVSCERACTKEPTYEQVSCPFIRSDGVAATSDISFVVNGVRGVCFFAVPLRIEAAEMHFYECYAN